MAETTTYAPIEPTADEQWAPWISRRDAARKRRDARIAGWRDNVNRRRVTNGRSLSAESSITAQASNAHVSVPKDWSLTKAKIAQLYSQTPEVRLEPRWPEFAGATQAFGKELNDTITACNIGATIEEELSDAINAAGIAAVIVSCDKRTIEVPMPVMDPVIALMTGVPQDQIPTMPVTQVADIQYLVDRISPADLLIPTDFTGSDYNKCRWIGRDGSMPWAQAVHAFGLTEEEKESVLGTDKRAKGSTNSLSTDPDQFKDAQAVSFSEIFYWKHYEDPEETNFTAIGRLVFVDGLETPKIDEPYKAQVKQPDGKMAGVVRLPIQVLTLTYISDDGLPPSDTEVGRFQVDELEDSRTDMRDQRRHSKPWRWGDTNRISANQRVKLDRGNWQDIIWTNGPGDRAIGEGARAAYPPERWDFDTVIGNDLTEIYQVGTNQAGAFAKGERSAREAGIIEKNFQRRVGLEQDKVQKHFLAVAEVLAGHLAIYGQFQLPDELGPNRQLLANAFVYSARVDSTVRLDVEQRIEQLDRFVNKWAQSGYLNPKPIAEEWATLINLNPARVIVDPQPKPPEPVKVSVSSALDLRDPLVFAMTMRTQQAPTPEDVAAAIKALVPINAMMPPVVESTGEQAQTGAAPPTGVQTPGITNPDWQLQPAVDKREEDNGA